MKTIINYTINDGIFVKFGDLSRELRQNLCKFYFFTEKNSYSEKPATINLVSLVEFGGEKYLKFPSNESYFKDCIEKIGLEVGNITDFRCDKKLEGFNSNITLRDNQIDMVKQLEACDYNGLITARTSAGKTVLSLKLAEILQVSMLFVVPRVSLMDNLLKDINILKPYGQANREPLFMYKGLKVQSIRTIKEEKHLKLTLRDDKYQIEALAFSQGIRRDELRLGDKVDVLCSVDINTYTTPRTIQLILQDFKKSVNG